MSAAPAMREKHGGDLAANQSVRVWLRLLSCAMVIEKRLRRGFADHFETTLPRFDVLAALDAHAEGLQLSALSQRLLVSNGNVTGLVQQLRADGLVETAPVAHDRRASTVSLTPQGRAVFADMAAAHHAWIDRMLGDLAPAEHGALHDLLGRLKLSLSRHPATPDAA